MSSISKNLITSILSGSIVLAIIVGIAIDYTISAALKKEFDQTLLQRAGQLMSLTKQANGLVEFDFADELMPEYERDEEPEYFQLLFSNDKLMEKSHSLNQLSLPHFAPEGENIIYSDYVLPNGRKIRLLHIAFTPRTDDSFEKPNKIDKKQRVNSSDPKIIILTIGKGRETLNELVNFIHSTLILAAIFFILCVLLIIRLSVKQSLKPLNDLATQISALDIQSLEQSLIVSQEILEINPIVIQLNVMLERLSRSFQRERQFSSDVSHELRTPVAELRLISEVGRLYLDDEEVLLKYFDDLAEISKQMEGIVTTLRALARCEENVEQAQYEILNLEPLINKIIKQVSRNNILIEKNICVLGDPWISVLTDPVKLQVILTNIIGNAVSYHDVSQKIEIDVRRTENTLSITITNGARDLCNEDIDHLFERFWRKDVARTDMHHSGLGLSLVKSFCDVLNIKVEAQLNPQQSFSIRLSNIAAT
ncbi:MAG: sensor histidine kinase [Thiohalomonadales bacterium]